MFGIFPLGPKQVFFRLLLPFFGYIVTAMLPQKRKNRRKYPLFLAPAENSQHALKVFAWNTHEPSELWGDSCYDSSWQKRIKT